MKEELEKIVGKSALSGVSSHGTLLKLAKLAKYYHTHLNVILSDLKKDEIPDIEYVQSVIDKWNDFLCSEKTEA